MRIVLKNDEGAPLSSIDYNSFVEQVTRDVIKNLKVTSKGYVSGDILRIKSKVEAK